MGARGDRRAATSRTRFLDCVLRNPNNAAILERAPRLALPDWWLTAGAVFQTVWNVLDGRAPARAISDYDLFYFDPLDLSADAEQAANDAAAELFDDLGAPIDVRNEARVHLWYEAEFGVPAPSFASSRDAIDHFAATTCCFAVTTTRSGRHEVYAPHGYEDLFGRRVVPNPILAPRRVYERKCERWAREWPSLRVEPWPGSAAGSG